MFPPLEEMLIGIVEVSIFFGKMVIEMILGEPILLSVMIIAFIVWVITERIERNRDQKKK